MGRLALVICLAALLSSAAGSAAPVPVETRTQAVLELQAAIEDERRALELLQEGAAPLAGRRRPDPAVI